MTTPQTSTDTAAIAAAMARGILLYCFAVLLLSVMDAVVKWLSAGYPIGQIVFFRSLFGLLPLLALVMLAGGPTVLRTRRPLAHLGRGLIGAAATYTFYLAFSLMPLADAYAIAFAAPLMLTALSVPMLGEAVGIRRWTAVLVGFGGVLIMLRPGGDLASFITLGAAMALAGTFFYALSGALIRRMSRTETTAALSVYGTLVVLVSGAVSLPFAYQTPSWEDLALFVVLGLLGGSGNLALTHAFRFAPVAVLGPFEYTGMLWAVLFGYLLWGDLPDAWILSGCAVVVASGLYILHRETRKTLPPRPPIRVDAAPPEERR